MANTLKLVETHRFSHPKRWYTNIWLKDEDGNVFVKVLR